MSRNENAKFSQQQRAALSQLKFDSASSQTTLYKEQIDELENRLPLLRSLLRQPARMDDVRKELNRVNQALKKASDALTRILDKNDIAVLEARNRLLQADFEIHQEHLADGETLQRTLSAIAVAHGVGTKARRDLPEKMRRRRNDPRTIEMIDGALLQGFIKHHRHSFRIRKGQEPHEPPATPAPPYMLTIREASPFIEIVQYCLEAAGASQDYDPVFAIKEYCDWRKNRRAISKSETPD